MSNIAIATWNVNSVRARLPQVVTWLEQKKPDVVCLQEIKCTDEDFPHQPFDDLGYNVVTHGQKTYNGVALLSRFPIEDIQRGIPDYEQDEQARYIEGVIAPAGMAPIRVASLYLPNGNPAPGPKYDYKLEWMEAFHAHALNLLEYEEVLVLAGDYNVIPEERDVYDPPAWESDALFLPSIRDRFRSLLNVGFTDALRACNDEAPAYTFWDYKGGAWRRNHGIRIDHLLLSPQATDTLASCIIHREVRDWEKPSDHVPVIVELRP
ncbi:MAG: exodeoxyribonuclease III [Parvularculales bacterium]